MKGTKKTLLALPFLMLLIAAGCQTGGPAGSITADGSSTVFPITQGVAEDFRAEAPDVQVAVGTSGTGGGFEKFCRGETDISDASRPIEEDEAAICAQNGVNYLELQIAIDGLSVLVNPTNTWTQCLTTEELKAIWQPSSPIKNWAEVRTNFPNRLLTLYGPGTDSGTFDYFTAEIMGEEGASRSDYTASEDDNVLVRGIAGDENALGYFGFAYYEQNTDKLKAVAVDAGAGCVTPTRQTIDSGDYSPLSRPLFIYVAEKATARPEVKSFVDFYLKTVTSEFLKDVGYVAVPADVLEKETSEWNAFAS